MSTQSGKVRSPSYPSMSLAAAVRAVAKIEQEYRQTPVTREDAVKLIGYTSLSGTAGKALAALSSYGLLERAGKGEARVTDRAKAILNSESPDERRQALEAAALEPLLFRELREKFKGVDLPPEGGIRSYLNRKNFNPSAVQPATSAFLETQEYLASARPRESQETDLQVSAEAPARSATLEGADERVSETGVLEYGVGVEPPADRQSGGDEHLEYKLSDMTRVHITFTGEMGARELRRLIRVLDTQREILEEDDKPIDGASGPDSAP